MLNNFVPKALNGLSSPVLGNNLTSITYWSTQMPFLDIVKFSREIAADKVGQFRAYTNSDLDDLGLLDAYGWPTALPEDATEFSMRWTWQGNETELVDQRSGTYVLDYEGEGTIAFSGGATFLSQEGSRITFSADGGSMAVHVTQTDPNGTGDYIRNVSIVKEEHKDLHEAGQLFNPDWLSVIEDYGQLRFMDWMATNTRLSNGEWSDRPQMEDQVWSKNPPLEMMVKLANQVGADPYFVMPHLATEDYIRNFAEYVRDNLDEGLTASVEFTNEAWNFNYPQAVDLLIQSGEEWGEDNRNLDSYYAYKATQMALIWKEVFGEEADARVQTILGMQTVSVNRAARILEAPVWEAVDPEEYQRPADVFDAIGVTLYFGHKLLAKSELRAELAAAFNDPNVDTADWLTEQIRDPENLRYGLARTELDLINMRGIADAYGLDMLSYEGGQHIFHIGPASAAEEIAGYSEFLSEYARSPVMGEHYADLWEMWETYGDGPFVNYGDVGTASSSSAFPLYDYIGDPSSRGETLNTLNETTTRWWDTSVGTAYQHGVISKGTDGIDTLLGTDAEDFLLGLEGDDFIFGFGDDDGLHGGAGNDTLNGGAGDDTLVGGSGTDTALYDGAYSAFTINSQNQNLIVTDTATGDVDRLQGIETLKFSDLFYDVATQQTSPVDPGVDPQEPESGVYIQSLNSFDTTFQELAQSNDLTNVGDMSGAAYFTKVRGEAKFLLPDDDPTLGTNNHQIANRHGVDTAEANGTLSLGLSILVGTSFNDIIKGGQHDEMFDGGLGSDKIEGGAGLDTALFAGAFSQYDMDTQGAYLFVTDTVSGDVDRLQGIETLKFSDVFYNVATQQTSPVDPGVDPQEPESGVYIQSLNSFETTVQELAQSNDLNRAGDMSGAAYFTKVRGEAKFLLPDDDPTLGTNNYQIANKHGVDTAEANGTLSLGLSILVGTSFDDIIKGGQHDEMFDGGLGSDKIEGGTGLDTVVFAGAFSQYDMDTQGAYLFVTDTVSGDVDRLQNIDLLHFADMVTSVDDLIF